MRGIMVTGAALCLVALAGCSANQQDSPSAGPTLPAVSSESAAETTEATPTGPALNARGNIVKALGEEGSVFNQETDATLLTFAVDSITADAPCDSDFQEAPSRGSFVAVDMRVSTAPELSREDFFTLGASDFTFIGADGVTVGDLGSFESFNCVGDDLFTQDQLGPAQSYVGQVFLDVPANTGTIVFEPFWGQSGGWEYTF